MEKIQVSIIPTNNYTVFSATNFIINLPSNTTISNPTFFYNITAVPGGGATEYGHGFSNRQLGCRQWISIDDFLMDHKPMLQVLQGNFTILNDFTNYVELDNFDRSGPPVNQANAIPLPIKLSDFTADRFADERASDLKWQSSSEINASTTKLKEVKMESTSTMLLL